MRGGFKERRRTWEKDIEKRLGCFARWKAISRCPSQRDAERSEGKEGEDFLSRSQVKAFVDGLHGRIERRSGWQGETTTYKPGISK